jgi:hypothetical protein
LVACALALGLMPELSAVTATSELVASRRSRRFSFALVSLMTAILSFDVVRVDH